MSTIDLSFTTVKEPLPDFIYAGLSQYATDSNSYHHQPDVLRQKLADLHSIPPEFIYLTAGADQAILLLATMFGKNTHVFTPTYISYTDVRRLGGELTEHPALNGDTYTISSDKIENASLIFLANPNNPAGITQREKVLELVQNNPDAKVVIDEAYGEFYNESVIKNVLNHKNLIVLRSFSKGYALAGFRIGYIVTAPELLSQLALESTWFNTTYVSVGAAVAALNHSEYFSRIRQAIIEERELTEEFLIHQGYHIVPSHINAVLIKFNGEDEALAFTERLLKAGIVVNHGNGASNCGLDKTYVRISVGNGEQMQAFRDTVSS